MDPVVVGSVGGVVLALAGSRVLEGVLFGVPARDPATFATAPSILVLVALIALALPAFRASRVDPVRTLREE